MEVQKNAEEFILVLRSGSCADIGGRRNMEDQHICLDNLEDHLCHKFEPSSLPAPAAFYGVFDGHNGSEASKYVCESLLSSIIEDPHFPNSYEMALQNSFSKLDNEIYQAHILQSGTTALAALVWRKTLVVANVGDCRAVVSRQGKPILMSTDHKPTNETERSRIESLGGFIDEEGQLEGEIGVSRTLGDWELKLSKWCQGNCPLSAEPDLKTMELTEEDEFLIMACDGLWDVISSEDAIRIVRADLICHNDPTKSSKKLVNEALTRNTTDNITVTVVCFSSNPPPRKHFGNSRLRLARRVEEKPATPQETFAPLNVREGENDQSVTPQEITMNPKPLQLTIQSAAPSVEKALLSSNQCCDQENSNPSISSSLITSNTQSSCSEKDQSPKFITPAKVYTLMTFNESPLSGEFHKNISSKRRRETPLQEVESKSLASSMDIEEDQSPEQPPCLIYESVKVRGNIIPLAERDDTEDGASVSTQESTTCSRRSPSRSIGERLHGIAKYLRHPLFRLLSIGSVLFGVGLLISHEFLEL